MDANQYGGAFIKAADAQAVSNVRILEVTEGTDYDNNPCLVLGLSGGKKYQLKVRDVNALMGIFGGDTSGWVNQAITLTVADDVYNDKPYKKFVITKYDAPQQAAPQQAAAPVADAAPPTPNFDSELGF
jgi:hypothetical protein